MALLLIGILAALLAALAVHVAGLRARVLRHERAGAELTRTVATVQGWAAKELRALRDEFTVARVDASAAEVGARLTTQRAASPALPTKPDEAHQERREPAALSEIAALEQPATSEKAPGVAVADALEEEPTTFWTGADAAHVRTEAAAGGEPRPPQATPRAALLGTVAPPASAPPFPPSNAGILAAGLGRPKSVRSAPRPPAGFYAAPTLLSMQAQGGASASSGRPAEPDDDDEQRATVATPAPTPALPARRSSHDDGKAPTVLALNPPMYARVKPTSSPEPLADLDLIGSEDIADEAARSHLGPDEQTPPRRGREAVLMRAFQPSETQGPS